MSKKDFIALADYLRPLFMKGDTISKSELLGALCAFCQNRNIHFKAHLFSDYLMGLCGPSGGKLK